LPLRENIRLRREGMTPAEIQTASDFTEKLLNIGEHTRPDEKIHWGTSDVVFGNKEAALSHKVFPNLQDRNLTIEDLAKGAILAPRNDVVDDLNNTLLTQIDGKLHTKISRDRARNEMVE